MTTIDQPEPAAESNPEQLMIYPVRGEMTPAGILEPRQARLASWDGTLQRWAVDGGLGIGRLGYVSMVRVDADGRDVPRYHPTGDPERDAAYYALRDRTTSVRYRATAGPAGEEVGVADTAVQAAAMVLEACAGGIYHTAPAA